MAGCEASVCCVATSARTRSTGSTASWENPLRLIACTRTADTPSIGTATRLDSEKPDIRAFG